MPDRQIDPGPVFVLTPTGRDAEGAIRLLAAEHIAAMAVPTLAQLMARFGEAVGLVLVADEACTPAELPALAELVADQPPWSDVPFIVLTRRGIGMRQRVDALALPGRLGNVLFLERPLNALSLMSAVKTALRARQRQRQVRAHIAERALAAEEATALLETRIAERTEALEAAEQERRRIASALVQSQRLEALGKLAAGIAHDFNNVLQAVAGGVALIEKRSTDAENVRRLAGMVSDATGRGAAITGRLLAFARQGELQAVSVAPTPLLHGLREILVPALGASVVIELSIAPDTPQLLADKPQLETVLVNLALNARDAMPDGGRLLLDVRRDVIHLSPPGGRLTPPTLHAGGYVRIELRDDGQGMDAATLARASEPFFTTKPVGQGTGLGLAMARGFCEQSGGALVIDSAPGVGTTVTLWFPEFSGAIQAAPASEVVVPPGARGLRIVVVDDDPLVRTVLAGQLHEQGYNVVQAADGLAALAWLERHGAPDLLVTDFAMPGMNGLALIDEARRHHATLPALLLTGYADAGVQTTIERDRTDTAITFLRKPVQHAELTRCAAELLRGSNPQA